MFGQLHTTRVLRRRTQVRALGTRPEGRRGSAEGAKPPLTGDLGVSPTIQFPLLLRGEGGQGDEVLVNSQSARAAPRAPDWLESRERKEPGFPPTFAELRSSLVDMSRRAIRRLPLRL